jgi:hypothetical protein
MLLEDSRQRDTFRWGVHADVQRIGGRGASRNHVGEGILKAGAGVMFSTAERIFSLMPVLTPSRTFRTAPLLEIR